MRTPFACCLAAVAGLLLVAPMSGAGAAPLTPVKSGGAAAATSNPNLLLVKKGRGGGGPNVGMGGPFKGGSARGPRINDRVMGPYAGNRSAFRSNRASRGDFRRGRHFGHNHRGLRNFYRSRYYYGALPYYYYSDPYYYDSYYYDDYPEYDDDDIGSSDAVARCEARYRSFDRATGTYLHEDGRRRLCPYLG